MRNLSNLTVIFLEMKYNSKYNTGGWWAARKPKQWISSYE